MENLISQIRTDCGLGDHIHLASQQVFQVLFDDDDIQLASSRLHFDQQVQIAGCGSFTPGRRTKQAHIPGAMPMGDFQDLPAFLLKELGKVHIGLFW